MTTLARRDNTILLQTGSVFGPAASYKVTVLPVGAQVATGGSATPITVRSGHGVTSTSKFIVMRGSAMVASSFRAVSGTPTDTSIAYSGAALTVVAGDVLINLGADTGSTSPNYNGSSVSIYTDMAGEGAAVTNSEVTTTSDGSYGYWCAETAVWELLRTSAGTPSGYIVGASEVGRVTALTAAPAGFPLRVLAQGAGLPDIVYVYLKQSDDTYAWVEVIRAI